MSEPVLRQRWLTIREAAERMGVTEKRMKAAIDKGEVRSLDVSHHSALRREYRVDEDSLIGLGKQPEKPTLKRLQSRDQLREGRRDVTTDRRAGIYFLWRAGEIVYVGQTASPGGVLQRIGEHASLGKLFDGYTFVRCRICDLDGLEALYIHELRPVLNRMRRQVDVNDEGEIVVGPRKLHRAAPPEESR